METKTPSEPRPPRHRLSTEPVYRKDGSVKKTRPSGRDQQYLWPILERYQVLPFNYIVALMGEHAGNLNYLGRHFKELCAEPNRFLKKHTRQNENGDFRKRCLCYS